MGKYQIWHVANPPCEGFRWSVDSPEAAIPLLDAIAGFDLFVGDGEDKPLTTVGARRDKLFELEKKYGKAVRTPLHQYVKWLTDRCGGVPVVGMNAQGLEVFEDDEWVEWYDPETGDDIREFASSRG